MDDNFFGRTFSMKNSLTDVPYALKENLSQLSPYLNINPGSVLPGFIFLDGISQDMERSKLAYCQIGASCMTGAALGGVGGFYNGMKSTTMLGQTGALRRTQLLNYVMKQGASRANTLGSIAVMYSGFGVILSWLRGSDDELNTVVAGTATGLLYKSTAGIGKCAVGGIAGLTISALYCLLTSRERIENLFH